MHKSDLVNIVIPVYNEGENFANLWQELTQFVTCPFRVYMVYDFDEDNTLVPVNKLIASGENRITLVKNKSRGVANAIYTGFEQISAGPVILVMADLSDDLKLIPKMLELYNQGYDVIVGSRYMPGGKIIDGPPVKQTLSRLAGISLKFLRHIPTHDPTNAFKLCDSQMLKSINLTSTNGFALTIEITVKAFLNNYSITQLPATWRNRTCGQSKFAMFKWMKEYLYWYFYAFQPVSKLR